MAGFDEFLELNEDDNDFRDYKKEKEEIQKYKDEKIEEWVASLREIDVKEVYEAAIDKSKSKEALQALKSDLLNDNPDDDPKVKQLVLKMQHRK